MGEVVQLSAYRGDLVDSTVEPDRDALVPVEFAVGLTDRAQCLDKISRYGIRDVQSHSMRSQPEARIILVSVADAIWLNKKILEREELSDDEISQRIDLIQVLENASLPLLKTLWQSLVQPSPTGAEQNP